MTPVVFDGCFGWLHAPRDGGDVAVVICTGLMQDALLSHCSLRLLADQLAEAGYWTLRFDYPGTGDSCGDADMNGAGGHWTAWRRSVNAAADWLRATTGARRLVLLGLRLGGAFAALTAAERDDVAGLVLLAPVMRGHSYRRQLLVEAQLQGGRMPTKGKDFEFREFCLSPPTLAQMGEIDLRRTRLAAEQKVAIFARTESKAIIECTRTWVCSGAEVSCHGWEGLEPLLRHNLIDENTLADFTAVMRWMRGAVPVGMLQAEPTVIVQPATLRPPGGIETPLRFGDDGRLFGMLCRPERSATETVVIIGNSGRDPHYGAARQAVALARRLAAAGVASLRMDFAGLGDSLGPAGKENALSLMFEVDRSPDIRAAVDALQGLGFRRFALQGLCAGAYHAFHGALAEPRITTLLLVNIPLFSLPSRDVLGYLQRRGLSMGHYLRKLSRRGTWATLLNGKADIGAALRAQSIRALTRLRSKALDLARWLHLAPVQSFAERAMATLAKRRVRILFLFSAGEAEIEAFAQEFGRAGAGLRGFSDVQVRIIPGMDHDLGKVAGRYAAETFMIDFVSAHRIPELFYSPRRSNAALA